MILEPLYDFWLKDVPLLLLKQRTKQRERLHAVAIVIERSCTPDDNMCFAVEITRWNGLQSLFEACPRRREVIAHVCDCSFPQNFHHIMSGSWERLLKQKPRDFMFGLDSCKIR